MGTNVSSNLSVASAKASASRADDTIVSGPLNVDQNRELASHNEQQSGYAEDLFWPRPKRNNAKWDQLCPYQLIVVSSQDGAYKPYKDWKFTLPLPPESMTISTPFAIQTSVLLDGILEEHNGAPLRHISFRGTTGFLPSRMNGASRADTGSASQLERIFGGTVNTVNSAVSSFKTAIDSATNSAPRAYNVYQKADFGAEDAASKLLVNTSGFAQIALLRDFLEGYVAAKKKNTDEYKALRLAVAIWKDDQVFLVTPMSFSVVKDTFSPMEYRYNLDFKAWKRIELKGGNLKEVISTPIRKSPNLIAAAINTLTNARKAVQKIGTLRQAVLGDIDYVMTPFRDTILLCKDTLGASISVADIPLAVQQKITVDVKELKYNAQKFWNDLTSSQTKDKLSKVLRYFDSVTNIQDMPSSKTGKNTSSFGAKSKAALKDLPEELVEQIPVSTLNLPHNVRNDILNDISRIRDLRRKDFDDYAARIRSVADKVAFLVGAGDDTYAEAYDIALEPIKSEPTQEDWETLNALNASIIVLQQFAATADGEPSSPTMLERFGGSAVASGIAWKTPVSKFAIPFPYGATMESLASDYLGSPNRFLEIVALNGLRAPYVDEVGYQIPLLVNGKDKTIVVTANDDLYTGKTVWLSSSSANRVQYTIESIRTFNGTSTLQLSDTVDAYKVCDTAVLESFLTGTVCSRNLIWIPSDVVPLDPDSVVTKDIPGVDVSDPMVSVGGVDLLLGQDEDLALVDGDLRYAIGLANIVQWVKIILSIEKGELPQHKDIGLPLSIGLTLSDFSADALLAAIKQQLSQDNTFSRLDRISVVQKGNSVSIDIGAVVAGTSQPLPLNYGMRLN